MALTVNHPTLKEQSVSCSTNSIGATPLAAAVVAPFRGKVVALRAVTHGTFITDCTVAVVIIVAPAAGAAPGAGTAITGGGMTITAANSAAGTTTSSTPTAANFVNEGDIIVFTPSGSTGTTIGATFTAVIQVA